MGRDGNRRRGLRAEGCTAVALWAPVEAGQECPLDLVSLQPFSCLPVGWFVCLGGISAGEDICPGLGS